MWPSGGPRWRFLHSGWPQPAAGHQDGSLATGLGVEGDNIITIIIIIRLLLPPSGRVMRSSCSISSIPKKERKKKNPAANQKKTDRWYYRELQQHCHQPSGGSVQLRVGLTISREQQRLLCSPAVHHVPQPDGPVPGRTGQNRLHRAEAQAADRPLVAPQDLQGQRSQVKGQWLRGGRSVGVRWVIPPVGVLSAWTTGRSQRSPELQRSPAPHCRLQPDRRTALAEEK